MSSFAEEFHRFSDKARPILGTCLYALAASAAAVGFQVAINWFFRHTFEAGAANQRGFIWISLAIVVVTSLITGWLLNSFAPGAAGSGIPQVKLNFWKEFGYAQRRIAIVKFIAGVLCIGGGQSLGREGPTDRQQSFIDNRRVARRFEAEPAGGERSRRSGWSGGGI